MSSPSQTKEQRDEELTIAIAHKTQTLVELNRKINDARDQARRTIADMQSAIDTAHKEFIEFINTLEIVHTEAQGTSKT